MSTTTDEGSRPKPGGKRSDKRAEVQMHAIQLNMPNMGGGAKEERTGSLPQRSAAKKGPRMIQGGSDASLRSTEGLNQSDVKSQLSPDFPEQSSQRQKLETERKSRNSTKMGVTMDQWMANDFQGMPSVGAVTDNDNEASTTGLEERSVGQQAGEIVGPWAAGSIEEEEPHSDAVSQGDAEEHSESAEEEEKARRQARLLEAVASAANAAQAKVETPKLVAAAQTQREQAVANAVEEATKQAWQAAQREARANNVGRQDDIREAAVLAATDNAVRATRDWKLDSGGFQEEQQADERRASLEQLEAERERANREAERLKSENAMLENSCTDYKTKLNEMIEQMNAAENEILEKEATLKKQREEHEAASTAATEAIQQEMVAALALSQSSVETLENEKTAAHKELESTQERVETLNEEVSNITARTVELDNELEQAKDVITQHEKELEASRDLISNLEKQLKDVDEANWALERQLKDTTGEKIQLEDLLRNTQTQLTEVTKKCEESIAQLEELKSNAARQAQEDSTEQKKAVAEEKAARELLIKKTSEANKSLQQALQEAQKELAKAKAEAAENKREATVASFAQNSVQKSLEHVKQELAETRNQLSRMQLHAKDVVEREREHVQHLTRELASTKEMLRVSQRAHRKAPAGAAVSKYGLGGKDIIKAAREQIFGRPQVFDNTNPEDEENPDDDEDVWGDLDVKDLSKGMMSPAQEDWESRADMASAVIKELESPKEQQNNNNRNMDGSFPSVRGASQSPITSPTSNSGTSKHRR